MKIKMIKTSASPAGVFQSEQTYEVGTDLDKETAIELIEVGSALEAELEEKLEVEDPGTEVEIKHVGGGWYELPNGDKVQGRDEALEALKSLNE